METCQKCKAPAEYKIENLREERKTYILCASHYVDLCLFIAAGAEAYINNTKQKDTN